MSTLLLRLWRGRREKPDPDLMHEGLSQPNNSLG